MACFTEREQVEVETAAEMSYAKIEDSSPPEGKAFACAGALGADPRELISQFASSAEFQDGQDLLLEPVAGTCGMAGCSALLSWHDHATRGGRPPSPVRQCRSTCQMVWPHPFAASRAARLTLQRMRWHVPKRG